MRHGRFVLHLLIALFSLRLLTACSSSSQAIDAALGFINPAPSLTNISDQIVAQGNLLKVDVNNTEAGSPGNDNGMAYTCVFNRSLDRNFDGALPCALIPDSTVTFDGTTGILNWTPATALGNYQLQVTGTNKDGVAKIVFNVGVRLKFDGIDNFTNVNGLGATVNWTPHPSAAAYQLFVLNTISGQYDLVTTISDPTLSSYVINNFQPNRGYSLRLEAIDALGFSDGNVVTKSFTTTDLVRIGMAPATASVTTGVSQLITAQIFNSDGTPQTLGGLAVTPQIVAGTSNGQFGTVTDHNDGTYSFTFTPTSVGSPAQIGVTTNMTFYLNNMAVITVNPGPANASASTLSLTSNTVISGQTVTLSATLKDAFGNAINSASVVAFTPTGGTSTGTLSAVSSQGSGVYSATYTGLVSGTAQTIGVTVGGVAVSGLTGSLQVVPGTPTSTNSTITVASSQISSGATTTITATLRDVNNNPVPSGVIPTFSAVGGTSSGTLSSITNAGAGVYTATYTGITAGTAQQIQLAVDSITLSPTASIKVVPGTANITNSSLSLTSTSVVSGNFVTATVILKDANNNPIDSGVSVLFSALGGTSTGNFSSVSNQGSGVYTIRYTGVFAGTPQTLRVMVNAVDLGLTASISVTPGTPAVANSTLSVSSATVTSGQSINVSAVLKDSASNPVPSGIVVTFNKVGGSSTGSYGSVTNAGNGTYTTTYTGLASGSPQTLSVLVGGNDLGLTQQVTVVPAALDLSNSSFIISATSVSSNSSAILTAVLKDLNGNPIASSSTVTITAAGGTSTGTIAAVVNQGSGTYTSAYKGVLSGTAQTLTVKINGVTTALNGSISVTPSNPDFGQSTLAIDNSSISSGTNANITATLKDSNGNLIPSGVTVTFTKTGGTSTGTFGPFTNVGNGIYTTTYTGVNSGSAQTIGVSVGGTDLGLSRTVTVTPAAFATANSSFITASTSLVSATSSLLTATFRDLNGNPIASSSTVTFVASGGTATGTISTVANQGAGVYTANYLAIKAGSAQTIKAYIGGVDTGYAVNIDVTPGAPQVSHSLLTISPTSIVSGAVSSLSATFKDINDNTIDGLSVGFTKTGGTSTGTFSTFVPAGSGVYTTTYTGVNSGSAQTVGVTLSGVDSGLTGTITVTPGSFALANSSFVSGSASIPSSTSTPLTATFRDGNNNPISSGSTVTFVASGGTATGTIATIVSQGNGVYTSTFTGVKSGTATTITAYINGANSGFSLPLGVTPGVPLLANSTLSVSAASIASNSVSTISTLLKDANSNVVDTGYTIAFTKTGGTSTGTLGTFTNAGAGVYTQAYTGLVSGTAQTIGVSVNGADLGLSKAITVTPAPFAAGNSTFTTSSSALISGQVANISATFKDTNNNPIDPASTITFVASGGSSTGTIATVTSPSSGLYNSTYSAVHAGTAQTVKAFINGVDTGLSVSITVSPAAPDVTQSTLAIDNQTLTSGAVANITATLKDFNGNLISTGIIVAFTKNGGSSTGTFSTFVNGGSGVYTTTYTGVASGSAQTVGLTVGGADLGLSRTITVVPAVFATANSSFVTSNATVISGSVATLTAIFKDANANPIASSSVITFVASGGTSTGTLASVVNQGSGTYTASYTGVKAGTSQTVEAYINGVDSGYGVSLTVTPGAPSLAKSTLASDMTNVTAGSYATLVATLNDANSNPISSGLVVSFTKTGGTSTGTFSAFTNTGSGTYTTTYTGTVAGTAQTIGVSVGGTDLGLAQTLTVVPAAFAMANSSFVTSNATVVSGASVNLTALFKDANANPIASSSVVTFVASGGTSTGTMASVVSQGGGAYTSTYSGLVAGTAQTIKAYINNVDTGYSFTLSVIPGAPLLANSTLTTSAASIASGSAATLTATLRDLNSNTISSGLTVTFTKTGGTSTGTLDATTNAGAGRYTTTYTGVSSGSAQTMGVSINGADLGLSQTITVVPAAFSTSNSSFVTSNATVVSGQSVNLTAIFKDANNNAIDPSSTITFVASGGTSTGTIATVAAQGSGTYTSTYSALAAGTAQTVKAFINNVDTGYAVTLTVVPGAPVLANCTLTTSSASLPSGSVATLTATLRDTNSNVISSGITVAFSKTGGTSSGTFSSFVNGGGGAYYTTYTGVAAGSAQTIGVSVGGVDLGLTTTIAVVPAAFATANSSFVTSNATVTSGASVNLTAVFKDSNSNPIASSSTVTFVASGGTSTGTIASVVNQGSGTYTSTYSGLVSGTAQTVKAFINGVDSGYAVTLTVVPGAPYLANSTITTTSLSLPSGSVATIAATLKDSNNNPISSGLTVAFSKTGGTSTGTLTAIVNAGSGQYTTTYTGVVSGTAQTIGVSVGGVDLGLTTAITVVPAAFSTSTSSFVTSNTTVVSGQSVNLTAVFKDANSNPIASSSTITFVASGGTSTGTIATVASQGSGTYTSTYSGLVAGTAQTVKAFINGVDSGYAVTLTVVPGAPVLANCSLATTAASIASGSVATLTATLRDTNNNPISSGLTVAFSKNGGTSTGTFTALVNAGTGQYTTTYTGVASGTAQTIGVSVGGVDLGLSASETVVPGGFSTSTSSFTTSNATVTSGSAVTLTAVLKDAAGNPIASSSTIAFSATGGVSTGVIAATTSQGSGNYTTTYTGVKSGTAQTAKVAINGTDTGYTLSLTVVPGAPNVSHCTLTTSAATISSGTSANLVATLKDANDNLISTGLVVAFTKTGGSSTGTFSTLVNAGSGQYTTSYTGVACGSAQTIGVAIGGVDLGLSATETVTPASYSSTNSSFTVGATTIVSGTSTTLSTTLRDLNGNPIDPASNVTFVATGGTSTGTIAAVVNQGSGVYTSTYSGIVAGTAQTLKVQINGVDTIYSTPTLSVTTGAPSPSTSTITVGSSTVISGALDLVTATIKDANNNAISTGLTLTFSKSGGSSTGTFSSVTNSGGGVYSANYQGMTAGTAQTIGISLSGSPFGPTTSITVSPGAPSNSLSTFTTSASALVAGQSATLTFTVVDSNSNPISAGYVMGITQSGGTSSGTLSAVTNQGNGVYTATYLGKVAGTASTFQPTVNAGNIGPSQTISVSVGVPLAANSSIMVTSSPLASGNTALISAVVKDAYNNPITTEYTITFDTIGGSSTGTMSSVTNSGGGAFAVNYQGGVAGTAQTVRVLSNGSPVTGLTSTLQVVPGAINAGNSVISIGSSTVASQGTTNITMNLRDVNSNAITSGLTLTLQQSGGSSVGTTTAVSGGTSGNYSSMFTGTTKGTATTITLYASGASTGLSVSVTVLAGAPDHLSVNQPANPLNSIDCNGPYTLTLQDASNNSTTSGNSIAVALTSSPANTDGSSPHTGTIFSDACSTPATSLTFMALQPTVQFWYKSYTPQSFTLNAAPTGLTALNITITNSPVLSWMGSAATFTMTGTGSQTIFDDRGGGMWSPTDVKVYASSGNPTYMYVADYLSSRIMKYDVTNNAFIGWVGHIGSLDGLSSNCLTDYAGVTTTYGSLPAGWCTGGRSNPITTTILTGPRGLAVDATYVYTSSNHRILRFRQSDGLYMGWIGKVSSIAGITGCTGATANAKTPGWCMGGTQTSGTDDGAFNNPQGLQVYGGYIYIADQSNNRIQKWDVTAGTFQGWIGNVGATVPTGPAACTSPALSTGSVTPTWCTGGIAQASNRRALANNPTEVQQPNEGFNAPMGLDSDGSYIFVADYNNNRVARVDMTGAPQGWIGRINHSSTGANMPQSTVPLQASGAYTSTWTQGGSTIDVGSPTGFGYTTGIRVDGNYLYVSDNYNRVSRVLKVDGSDQRWIGRTTAAVTGGYPGCSSTPVSAATPGWCLGGSSNRLGNANLAFNIPGGVIFGLDTDGTTLYIADRDNMRVQRVSEADGHFLNWIGGATTVSSSWNRTPAAQVARGGIDDYSFNDFAGNTSNTGSYFSGFGLSTDGKTMFMVDPAWHRIKQYNKITGTIVGYIGQIGAFPPTGPDDCYGYTTGQTPDWCYGGGRIGSSSAIQGYNYPFGVAADATYIYVADYSNNRIDRVQISGASYAGWIGKEATTPTDGPGSCTTAASITPNWCIGGTASGNSTGTAGMFNSPRALVYDPPPADRLYAIDNTSRIMRIVPSTGAFEAVMGNINTGTATSCAGAGSANNTSDGFCATATAISANASNYGNIYQGSGSIAINSTYIFASDLTNHRITRFYKSDGRVAGFLGKISSLTGLNVASTENFDGNIVTNPCSGYASVPKNAAGWCSGTALGTAITTIAGTDDGSFNMPRGLWADSTYLYVLDTGNHRIVKITIATGAVVGWKGYSSTLGAVNTTWTLGGTGVPSTLLGGFDYPAGMTGDANYLYVHDARNNRVVTIPK